MLFALGFKDIEPYDLSLSLGKIGICASLNSDVEITLDEFLHLAAFYIRQRDETEEIDKLFEIFDGEDEGVISFDNLKKVAQEVGLNIRDYLLHEMISEADKDHDGVLNISEFRDVIKRNNTYF